MNDILEAIKLRRIWLLFGWFEIRKRYRRSLLGPLWITASIAIMVAVMGGLYAKLFSQPYGQYLPFLGCSLVLWYYIAQSINEGCFTYIEYEQQIKQIALPVSVYAFQLLWRHMIIMFHNLFIAAVLLVYFKYFSIQIIFFPFTVMLVAIIFFCYNVIIGMFCARYRDIPQIVQSIMQVMMFVTPVFWKKSFAEEYWWVTFFNPLFHIIELMRAPLLMQPLPMQSLLIVSLMAVAALIACNYAIKHNKDRLAFWM